MITGARIVDRAADPQDPENWEVILWVAKEGTSKEEWGTHIVAPSGDWYFGRYGDEEAMRKRFEDRKRRK